MCKDYMRSATMKDYRANDIHFVELQRGEKKKLETMARRKARRKDKQEIKRDPDYIREPA